MSEDWLVSRCLKMWVISYSPNCVATYCFTVETACFIGECPLEYFMDPRQVHLGRILRPIDMVTCVLGFMLGFLCNENEENISKSVMSLPSSLHEH